MLCLPEDKSTCSDCHSVRRGSHWWLRRSDPPNSTAFLLSCRCFLAGFGSRAAIRSDAISAIIYPTSIRSIDRMGFRGRRRGSGFGPIVGGMLVAKKLPLDQLFIFAAIPFAVGTIAAIILLFAYNKKFGGYSMQAGAGASAAHD